MTLPVLETGWTISESATARGSFTLAEPSGLGAGDTLVMMGINDNPSGGQTWDTKTDWTRAFQVGNNRPDCTAVMYWKPYDGTESWPETFQVTSGTYHMGGVMLRISGADTSDPIHKFTLYDPATISTTTHPMPGFTTTLPDCLCLYGFSFDGGDGDPFATTPDPPWSEFQEIHNGLGAADGGGCFGQRDLATAGASGTVTITNTGAGDGGVGFQFAIAPVAAVGTNRLLLLNPPTLDGGLNGGLGGNL